MTARYTLVHFVPDPLAGTRVPVAVVAETPHGPAVIVRKSAPSARVLGGLQRTHLLRATMTEIASARSVELLPAGLGPHVIASEPRPLPTDVPDVEAWARAAFFGVEPELAPPHRRGRQRATRGYQYLTNLKVASRVQKNFEPRPAGWLPTAARLHLPRVSHFVPGIQKLLLMEPIDLSDTWERDTREVATRLAAYGNAVQRDGAAERVTLLAYVLPGGAAQHRAEAAERIRPVADVVDCAESPEVARFVDMIRTASPPAFG